MRGIESVSLVYIMIFIIHLASTKLFERTDWCGFVTQLCWIEHAECAVTLTFQTKFF